MPKVIVHGVHRSGTSLTASLLDRAGCWYADKKQQMAPQEDNPKGFWERVDVVALNDEILAAIKLNWFTLTPFLTRQELKLLADQFDEKISLIAKDFNAHDSWFLKDPRLSITWPLWSAHLTPTHHIVVHRNPISVAKSLYSRNGIAIEHGLMFWFHQTRMIASALAGQDNVVHIEFGSQKHLGRDAIRLINGIVSSNNLSSHKALSENDFESLYEPSLIHHRMVDEPLFENHSVIEKAWRCVQAGCFDGLLELPEIKISDLTWRDLDSRAAIGSQFEISARQELHFKEAEINLRRVIDTSWAQNKELNEEYEKLSTKQQELSDEYKSLVAERLELKDEIEELNLRLLKIFGSLKNYMSSKRYVSGDIVGRVFQKIKLARPKTLQDAMNIAVYGQSAADLESYLPKQSNRTVLLKALIRNPVSFLRRLTAKRVLRAIKVLFGREVPNIDQSLLQYADADILSDRDLEIFDAEKPGDWENKMLEFEQFDSPQVSIVIPVYNNYLTTLACLHSIKKHTDPEGIDYEVIIADDSSTDQTKDIAKSVLGLRVIRAQHNQGFLKNCNSAIQEADGTYVVLLNNDTNVQRHWLSELLAPLESSPEVGVTGPMFLYPDGRLQEAGGIVFSDASGWNYGRLDNPSKPEYNFSRDVDYISGACLVFRKALWNQIGGFDEVFTPAYYEDTDFCFETKKLGLKVRYVSTAKVVHFEGVSHGSDEDSGVKKYQVINRGKFFTKWEDWLEKNHYADSSELFSARVYGRHKKTLLFIDHYVPFYDKDAGSKVAQRYLELLVQEGVHVIFLGDNFYPHQPYTEELQAMGIEVLHGEYYKNNWYEWLQKHSSQIDTIYLNRPHISRKYIDKIRELEHQPHVAYHGADLHYVRVAREESLGIDSGDGVTSQEWKTLEFDLMSKCDVSLWLSENEVDVIREVDSSLNVAYKPMYWFGASDLNKVRNVESSKELLFVGGFGHPPNKDGLEWFLNDIYPSVLESYPNCRLTVIGSNCPDEIKSQENENIIILGHVSEQELINAYSRARIAVVPLRYGAGVKGKVIEGMQHGVPILTTPIGAEGLPANASDFLTVAEDSISFISELNLLLESDQQCQLKIERSDEVLRTHFSVEAAKNALKVLLPEKVDQSSL